MTIGNDGTTRPDTPDPAGEDMRNGQQAAASAPARQAAPAFPPPDGRSPADARLKNLPADAAVTTRAACVRAALERVLVSDDLRSSPRLATFLRFVVEATLAGRAEQIKGYTIAVEALGRPSSFDPQADPIVRVEATRLRRALQSYYSGDGQADPLRILIPKGGYVPVFEDRISTLEPLPATSSVPVEPAAPLPAMPAGAGTGEEGALPVPPPPGRGPAALPEEPGRGPSSAPVSAPEGVPARDDEASPVRRASGWRLAGYVAAGLVAGMAMLSLPSLSFFSRGLFSTPAGEGGASRAQNRVRLPIVEVGEWSLAAGARQDGAVASALDVAGLRRLEERLRDAFAQFDFVDVRASARSGADQVRRECSDAAPRSVFSLNGMAVPRADGGTTLLLHLTDRCSGVIIWSSTLEGPTHAADVRGEQAVVRELSTVLMENYGVVPVRARSRVLAQAPQSGFGCIAETFAILRGDGSAEPDISGHCLAELTVRDREFALGHAVRAAALLDQAMRQAEPLSEAGAALILREAELAVDLAPSSAFAARTLAQSQLFLGESAAALASGARALQLNPLDFDVAATVGQVFIGAGRVEEGEALLMQARAHGAARLPLQDAYLALAAFLKHDVPAARSLLPQLSLHPSPQNRIAQVLALHMLGREGEAQRLVRTLTQGDGGNPEAVHWLVRHLLPTPELYRQVLVVLEDAGLPGALEAGKPPRG
ncbi:tetratricopeptide repeat protein [Xanthobacter sp. TB0139]|uniref:tetratricopeptide repeat protein n=1 Tax=Xanthobacter sp. TB0139 TaxID=3459178 RepID=UPI004039712B